MSVGLYGFEKGPGTVLDEKVIAIVYGKARCVSEPRMDKRW